MRLSCLNYCAIDTFDHYGRLMGRCVIDMGAVDYRMETMPWHPSPVSRCIAGGRMFWVKENLQFLLEREPDGQPVH